MTFKKEGLITQKIKLNGVPIEVSFSSKLKIPTIVNTNPKANANTSLRRIAMDCLKI